MQKRWSFNALAPSIKECWTQEHPSDTDPAFRWLRLLIEGTKAASFQSSRILEDGRWWVMFRLDITHPKVWDVIQEYAHICYGRVANTSLPVRLMPFSTSPENGGPEKGLLWRIECFDPDYSPNDLFGELRTHILPSVARLPK